MIWITADWHLGETRMELMERPMFHTSQAMYLHLLDCHNSKVKPDDLVIVVGDAVSKARDNDGWIDRIGDFNGRKILIRGNHDEGISDEVYSKYFEKIVPHGDGMEMTISGVKCWITHYPTRSRTDMFNLVGHIHGRWHVQKNMMNVGVDVNHFYPFPEDKVPYFLKAIEVYFDDDVWCSDHPANIPYHARGKKSSYFKDDAKPKMFFLQNLGAGYVGNSPLWWRKNGSGYTTDINDAEQMTLAECTDIQNSTKGSHTFKPWPVNEVLKACISCFDPQKFDFGTGK